MSKSWLGVGLLGVLGAVAFFHLFPTYAPQASVDFRFTRSEVLERARHFLQEEGFDPTTLSGDANFRFDAVVTLYLEDKLGLAKAHQVLRADTLATHDWHVYFYDASRPLTQMEERFNVWLSPTGRVLGFQRLIPDSVAGAALPEEEARALAENFLRQHGIRLARFDLESSTATQRVARKDYYFKWTRRDSVFGLANTVWVRVQGDRVGGFHINTEEPEVYQNEASRVGTQATFIVTASSVATFVLLIFVIMLFLKKYHEGEVGIRTAVWVFAVLFGLIAVEYALKFTTFGYGTSIADVNRANVRLVVFFVSLLIGQLFLAAMVLASWSVGESSARRGWSEKLTALDGLYFGKPFTLAFAASTVRGYAFGFGLLGLIYGIVYFVATRTGWAAYVSTLHGIPESVLPSLSAVTLALRVALLNEIVFRLFFLSWLREKTGKTWPGILTSSAVWTLVAFTLWDVPVGFPSFDILVPAFFVLSVIFGLIVVRFDLLTAIVTNFVLLAFTYAIPILVSSADAYQNQTVLFYVLMALPLAVAVVGFVKRQSFKFTLELQPAHIRRISERERMAKELEIARNVQMSLLPKQNPLTEGYDIAGVCIPALEVGGDYYDFFHLGDGRIGIAIGDVSGKGVPAAIYMTLTKGILQSYAAENESPKAVLDKLNRQMYTNIERSSFVSLFYAVLDMKRGVLRFARAGHNPAILVHSRRDANTLLEPKGMAVGLEAGERFGQLLEEHEIQLESGDVLTFYTDGFTEASTRNGDEFGERRLEQVISEHKNASANVIIQEVVRRVKRFVGSHPQHDDMTMVVVKVL